MAEQQKRIIDSLRLPVQLVALLWGVHFIQMVSGMDFGKFGVFPREVFGLRGILFSPLIHSGLPHLISNSAPLFVLSLMIVYFYPRVAKRSMLMIYFLTGLAVWIFARRVFHIGASGVVYGLVSFVFWMGIFRRSLKSIVLALIVTVLYSSYFLGILPNQEGISWESHLLGGLVGIFTAYWYKEEIETDEEEQRPVWEDEPLDSKYFLERDIFEKTKAEREG
ncbi:MAG TPA: rhomboid family intramembrane serine protease [Bacteroidetes bacterium]|nr:rhomboid family intramembrane serine protease [Bacteroidota bacterium]